MSFYDQLLEAEAQEEYREMHKQVFIRLINNSEVPNDRALEQADKLTAAWFGYMNEKEQEDEHRS